jgi:hypothetical protein
MGIADEDFIKFQSYYQEKKKELTLQVIKDNRNYDLIK